MLDDVLNRKGDKNEGEGKSEGKRMMDSCNEDENGNRNRNENRKGNKKGQVTVFVILAVVIIALVVLFFMFRGSLGFDGVPKEFQNVYDFYLSCIDVETKLGANLLGQQAGYIESPEFEPGSVYMPFSSQLDFLGNPVPYWYYVSGNGLQKEQMPSKEDMEMQLDMFLEEQLAGCDFSSFVDDGYVIEVGREVEVETRIKDNEIEVNVLQDLNIYFGEDSWSGGKHSNDVNSNLGKFYELARKTFEDFKESMFLEEYGVDVLRLNAPVDGTEISCSPLIWSLGDVAENLTRGLEANIGFIKLEGDYYELSEEENKYFVHDIGEKVDANVQFLYLREWPMKVQVWPSENGILKAEPVGNQDGMGMLGFCYVPYHFVYDLAYPVMIQYYYNDEIFQFPVVVYINKNNPREPVEGEARVNPVPELCLRKNTEVRVNTYNVNLEAIEADLSYKCFDTQCDIGRSFLKDNEAVFIGDFPQCVNGYVVAKSEGYEAEKVIFSTVNGGDLDIYLKKSYKLDLEVLRGNFELDDEDSAIVTFKKDGFSKTVSYPDQNEIELSEGQYEIKAIIYSDASINLEGSERESCVDVPVSGLFGLLGRSEEKCFDISIPGQRIDRAVSGGGTQNYYFSESELEGSRKVVVKGVNFGMPGKIEDIQVNFNNADVAGLGINLE
jgi:hypothetical protein